MFQLHCHENCEPGPVRSINVQVGRTGEGYRLWYFLVGDIDRIAVPPRVSKAGRRDKLWEATCFEAFLKGEGDGYRELNFSPSGEWASYAFARYREGMRQDATAVTIHYDRLDNLICLEARFNAHFGSATHMGLAAVIEATDGTKSYWSLAHPDGPPDFHHDACFAVRLADIA